MRRPAPKTSRRWSTRSARPKRYGFENLRDWFKTLYETLLGSAQGPRMGSFIALYGIANSRALIEEALARQA
jgi:lysyl-tRNA synthetase, class I